MSFGDVLNNNTFIVKTTVSTFWLIFGTIGLLFIPVSGHTGVTVMIRSKLFYFFAAFNSP